MKFILDWFWTYCLLMLIAVLPLGLCSLAIVDVLLLFVTEPVTFALSALALSGAVAMVWAKVFFYCLDKYPNMFD